MPLSGALQVERRIVVDAAPERVLRAFFDHGDLVEWWRVWRSDTVPRALGTYLVEWGTLGHRDEVLGRLGGRFQGTVMDYRAGEEFFVADAYWTPPDGEPIGPMALEVRCKPLGRPRPTEVFVRQGGVDDGLRWQRYFEVVSRGWQQALVALKRHLEAERRPTPTSTAPFSR